MDRELPALAVKIESLEKVFLDFRGELRQAIADLSRRMDVREEKIDTWQRDLSKQVSMLERARAWLAGALAALVFMYGALVAWLKR
jgi:hypothetical protein